MGQAKYAEELRNKASRSADSDDSSVHPAIAQSRGKLGRIPKRLTAEALTDKLRRVDDKLVAGQQKRREQSKNARAANDCALEEKATALIAVLHPEMVEENARLVKQDGRLLKYIKLLDELVKSKEAELAMLRGERIGR